MRKFACLATLAVPLGTDYVPTSSSTVDVPDALEVVRVRIVGNDVSGDFDAPVELAEDEIAKAAAVARTKLATLTRSQSVPFKFALDESSLPAVAHSFYKIFDSEPPVWYVVFQMLAFADKGAADPIPPYGPEDPLRLETGNPANPLRATLMLEVRELR